MEIKNEDILELSEEIADKLNQEYDWDWNLIQNSVFEYLRKKFKKE